MIRTCFVILNFNNFKDTEKCINRLVNLSLGCSEILVVDNHSSDNSASRLRDLKNFFDFTLLFSDLNLGFAAGNNLGIKYAKENNFDYVVLLNNDVEFDGNIFSPMEKYLEKNKDVAVVGPSIMHDGKLKNIGNTINFTKISYDNAISLNKISTVMEADFLIGACLIVSISAIRKVGLLPEIYFLNYEETEWQLKFKKNGYHIRCLTEYTVNHSSGGTIGKFDGMQVYFLRRNIIIFTRRNAPFSKKIIFFLKLFPYSILQCMRHMSLFPIKCYMDGLTERNKYDYLK